ncbi:hypothetical protein [Clostridium tagluense]|uniref:hypothetical protein n=1 Tax=Clostridium tagluense TaxID=360422 RepID=UPI001C0AB062|nr:hypothetical protein [Clostridium tagluense]MBU3130436.1 hypothetical protein [Clostridium tagluense]
MNKIQIIKPLIPGALLSYEKYNILPSLTIAETILETSWLQYVKGKISKSIPLIATII